MQNGGTALYLASHQGHCGVVRMLLEAKADVNIQRNVSHAFHNVVVILCLYI